MKIDHKSRERVFHYLVEDHAKRMPDKPCLVMNDRVLTYGELDREINRWARGLAARGVTKGDRVLVMITSGIEHVAIWQAISRLGALIVPVNEAYKGAMLLHQVNDADATLAIVHGRHLAHWEALSDELTGVETIAVYPDLDPRGALESSWELIPFPSLRLDDASPLPAVVSYTDPMAIFYTSGTTGPSKGVIYSHGQAHATALPIAKLCGPDEIFYMYMPMFHVGLSQMFGFVAIAGITMAIREKFSVQNFWPDVRRYDATISILISTMPSFLTSLRPDPRDRDHNLKKMIIIPLPPDLAAIKERYGFEVTTFFNMTEISVGITADGFNLVNDTSCGRPREGLTARIVDEDDEEVPVGEIGELVLRADNPWEFNSGYWRNPEKTIEAWRNQWLHTGDAFRCDADGNYYFVDRLKDAIRRRGENISSFEVEREVDAHPAVLESAAVAVPSPHGEDEVLVVASLRPGHALTGEALCEFLAPRLPRYMVPRFVRLITDELPKTPTGKIRKAALRDNGIAEAWDGLEGDRRDAV
jgi:crotonobetaine/carnitine-CoA ligase